ncbi:hypothetical protein [uncultured Croceitalea sp.]|uniref:hypothetical protein n=1 Tax=uncultured Croceitalea sp. TaxID=1798908 RepID=UPI003305C57D
MRTNKRKQQYQEWFSADEMHKDSLHWTSELKFAKDEQRFLDGMIRDYTLDLLNVQIFDNVKKAVDALHLTEKELIHIFKKVQLHENQLAIMIDDVDQIKMENAYIETHVELAKEIKIYFDTYRAAKSTIFDIISSIMKKKKQKRLLN